MKSISGAVAALVVVCAALAISSRPAAADFARGQCVTVNGVPGKVLGPSPVQGLILVQGDRGGGINGWLPEKIVPAPCPGARIAKASCPASEPDSDGGDQLNVAVRYGMRRSIESVNGHPTVRFNKVVVGRMRTWTAREQIDIADGDVSKGIVSAQADYVTCLDDGTYVTRTRRQRDFRCFTSAIDHRPICMVVSGLGGDAIVARVPKY
jgi:hypothetical protein